ncbi:hypothetical protein CQW23_25413 [Capsicum baccatum]|uniref:Uncharacterized protein n=1 Tax=Capsicum baccatum TaxID=33114 RepID=A0A2G2VKY3_CAPBA|nr:hypothetical protein CQW23_25413 [Capsicum baccatum]
MEHLRQDEIEDLSLSPPAVGSMQIAGSNGFRHNIEFMSQAYLRNRSSEIDIEVEDDTSIADKDQTLPIFLKVIFSLTNLSFLRNVSKNQIVDICFRVLASAI